MPLVPAEELALSEVEWAGLGASAFIRDAKRPGFPRSRE
jgi:hypothetical protein